MNNYFCKKKIRRLEDENCLQNFFWEITVYKKRRLQPLLWGKKKRDVGKQRGEKSGNSGQLG